MVAQRLIIFQLVNRKSVWKLRDVSCLMISSKMNVWGHQFFYFDLLFKICFSWLFVVIPFQLDVKSLQCALIVWQTFIVYLIDSIKDCSFEFWSYFSLPIPFTRAVSFWSPICNYQELYIVYFGWLNLKVIHTTYSWNNKWQKCAGMGLNGFIFKRINEK